MMFNQFTQHEEAFRVWRRDGMPGLKPESYDYVDFLSAPDDDQAPRDGTLWQHQWDAFLRVVYAHEILGRAALGADGLLLNIVTGGGKTAIIAAVVAWLRIAHDVRKFVMLCPNLIVRDRLDDDFAGGKVFKDRDLLPADGPQPGDFLLTTLGGNNGGCWADLLSADVVIGNIHQFYQSNKNGRSNLSALMNGPKFALFNDEAHNSPAPEYDEILKKMREHVALRLDTTATPDRADGNAPDSAMICEYDVRDALDDSLIKTPVVYQPNIKTVQLTYTDARSGEQRKVEEIDWDEVDRLGVNATQWVTDDAPMRQQMAIALNRMKEQEMRAKNRYQPILFVVAVCRADARKAAKTLKQYFKVKTLLVIGGSDEKDRQKALELGRQKRTGMPYRAVVSVLMLREGWDLPEVGVILLLRKFGSKVYGQQVIGRGLRRVRTKKVKPDDSQICAVVDHPKLEHEWLWDMLNAKRRKNVEIDDLFDETEDLQPAPPKQKLEKPELAIEVPPLDPSAEDEEFVLDPIAPPPTPLEDWKGALERIEYDPVALEITKVGIDGVTGRELGGKGWTSIHSPPDATSNGEVTPETDSELREAVKEGLLAMAEELIIDAGYATAFKGRVYSALLHHARAKFLNGSSIGLAERDEVDFAWKMLAQMRQKVESVPGLVAGVVVHGD
ncbi:MAG: DEAD/DEAH box helicase family protein [Gammaproteobacteria bacterium]